MNSKTEAAFSAFLTTKKSTEPTVSKPKHSSNQTHPGHSSKSGSVWKPILTDRNGKQTSTHHSKMMSFWISEPFLCKVFPSILLHLIKPTSVLSTCLWGKTAEAHYTVSNDEQTNEGFKIPPGQLLHDDSEPTETHIINTTCISPSAAAVVLWFRQVTWGDV